MSAWPATPAPKARTSCAGSRRWAIPIKGRHVIIVDDIFDTGHTLAAVIQRLKELGAADVKVCVLLQKKKGQLPVKVDWVGFKIPNEFVVGYGLDYNGRYRGLKQIRVLENQAV